MNSKEYSLKVRNQIAQNEVKSGIFQGTVLGPILFLVFINDFPSTTNNTCCIFADDTKVYQSIKAAKGTVTLPEDLGNLDNGQV